MQEVSIAIENITTRLIHEKESILKTQLEIIVNFSKSFFNESESQELTVEKLETFRACIREVLNADSKTIDDIKENTHKLALAVAQKKTINSNDLDPITLEKIDLTNEKKYVFVSTGHAFELAALVNNHKSRPFFAGEQILNDDGEDAKFLRDPYSKILNKWDAQHIQKIAKERELDFRCWQTEENLHLKGICKVTKTKNGYELAIDWRNIQSDEQVKKINKFITKLFTPPKAVGQMINGTKLSKEDLDGLKKLYTSTDNHYLTGVGWVGRRLEKAELEVFSMFIGKSPAIYQIHIISSELDDDQLMQLVEELPNNTKLNELNLANNCFNARGMQALCTAVQKNFKLRVIDLTKSFNTADEEQVKFHEEIQRHIRINQNIARYLKKEFLSEKDQREIKDKILDQLASEPLQTIKTLKALGFSAESVKKFLNIEDTKTIEQLKSVRSLETWQIQNIIKSVGAFDNLIFHEALLSITKHPNTAYAVLAAIEILQYQSVLPYLFDESKKNKLVQIVFDTFVCLESEQLINTKCVIIKNKSNNKTYNDDCSLTLEDTKKFKQQCVKLFPKLDQSRDKKLSFQQNSNKTLETIMQCQIL